MADIESDRELLELAARAAALDVENVADYGGLHVWFGKNPKSLRLWSPLTDDGDALRLATKLNLVLTPQDGECSAEYAGSESGEYIIRFFTVKVQLNHGVDKSIAMRRAIVNAAAEIGLSVHGG